MVDLGSGIQFDPLRGVLNGTPVTVRQAERLAAELLDWARRKTKSTKSAAAKRRRPKKTLAKPIRSIT